MQRHRGTIERSFASLKKFHILQGCKAQNIRNKEEVLDCAVALHNLNVYVREKRLDTISLRPPHQPLAHIITKDLELPQLYPKAANKKLPSHLKEFQTALFSIKEDLAKVMERGNEKQKWSNRVIQRGENLWKAGNVLQIQVKNVDADLWWVKMHVGATMRSTSYVSLLEFTKHSNIFRCMCDCTNG